jgi:hypothetical protein
MEQTRHYSRLCRRVPQTFSLVLDTTPHNTMARPLKVSPSPSSQEHISLSSPSEEREGLLSGVDTLSAIEAEELKQSSLFRLLSSGLARTAVIVAGLLCLVFSFLHWFSTPPSSITPLHFNGDTLRSNGTHDFKRTVLLVSIDGLRDALFDIRSYTRS